MRISDWSSDVCSSDLFNRDTAFPVPAGSDLAPSYNNVDLRLFYYSPDKRWTAEFFATNLFNTVQVGNLFRGIGFTDVAGGGGPEITSYKPPRMYGVDRKSTRLNSSH